MTTILPHISPDLAVGCLHSPFPRNGSGGGQGLFSKVRELSSLQALTSAPDQGTPPSTAYLYRSSLLEVCQQSQTGGWILHWDEKFFEYFEYILLDVFSIESMENSVRTILFKLLCIHAEYCAMRWPLFALASLGFAQEKVRVVVPERRMSDAIRVRIIWIYLLVRTLVYLHEQAHHDIISNENERATVAGKLDLLISEIKARRLRRPAFGGEVSEKEMAEMIVRMETSNGEREETIVDYLAFTRLLLFEKDFRAHLKGAAEEEALALVYPAVMIWHYLSTTVWGIKRHLKETNALRWNEYRISPDNELSGSGHVRNNLRGFLILEILLDFVTKNRRDIGKLYATMREERPLIQAFYFGRLVAAYKQLLSQDWRSIARSRSSQQDRTDALNQLRAALLY